jgi:3-oxoacyl-[acyl-carrier protein] reductase
MKLKDRVVMVTGGSKGIGKAVAEAMAAEGAHVVINYSSDQSAIEHARHLAEQYSAKVVAIKADITSQQQVDAMIAEIKEKFSKIDILVSSAGIFDEHDSPDNPDAFRNVFEVNLLGQVRVANAVRKLMAKGKIIFVSSISGGHGQGAPDSIAYAAMKAALDSYMRNLARALAPDVLVNAVAPGATLTPMWGKMDEAYKAEIASGLLINRWISPAEVADGIIFLAKNDAICGEVLVLDGGDGLKH